MTIENNLPPLPPGYADAPVHELGYELTDIDEAIAKSEELLTTLVPGVCRKDHVMAYCQQAPIARYLQSACPGGVVANPWTPKSARKFVKMLQTGKLTARTIIQIAYLTTIGKQTIRYRLERWITEFNAKEIEDIEFDLTMAKQEACRLLVAGHFGTLADAGLQDSLRQNEMAHLEGQMRFFIQYVKSNSNPRCSSFSIGSQGPVAFHVHLGQRLGFPDLVEYRDSHKEVILQELAENACLRYMVMSNSDQEVLDVWGFTRSEILNESFYAYLKVHARCDVLGINYSEEMEGLDVWSKYKGMGYAQM